MANTTATLIGSYESVRVMAEAGVPDGAHDLRRRRRDGRARQRRHVSVYPSQHSCVWSHTTMHAADEVCLGDLGVTWHEQQRRMGELMQFVTTSLAPPAIEHVIESRSGHSTSWRRRRARLRVRHPGRPAAVPGHVGPLERRARATCDPTWRSSPRPGEATSTVSRSRARSPSSSPARSRCCSHGRSCSATTTTGSRASPSTPTSTRSAKRSRRVAPGTRLLELGYVDATPILP